MRKILIVEDNAVNRAMLNKMLSTEYAVVEVSDGEDALDIVNREYSEISAVLLDIGLPGIDGYEVLSRIRQDKRFANMPVIMITGSDDEATRVKSLKLGANDFVMKPYNPEVIKHCLQNNIALSEENGLQAKSETKTKSRPFYEKVFDLKRIAIFSCVGALICALFIQHFKLKSDLEKNCENVAVEFSSIMESYRHSFKMLELLLQEEIYYADNIDEIEIFLKEHDKQLLEIEGSDYDGVYMYYKDRYLYSWDTPYSAYSETGYDATKRPWYIGAIESDGEIFFSTPYPSYANDYMLATISRLQKDGETVIAYDIKLGEISKYVERLYLFNQACTLLCDSEGNIIGSSNNLYVGGNYNYSSEKLNKTVEDARKKVETVGAKDESAVNALKSAEAQRQLALDDGVFLSNLLKHKGTLQYSFKKFSFGYVYADNEYSFFVITPITTIIPQISILWAALSFAFILLTALAERMIRKNHQILSDVLTGLNNRRAFLKYCDNHILHHADENLGLIMLDLNHFKKINDVFGHSVGDLALIDAANVLKSACGASTDNYFLCRYGGDEFLLAARVDAAASLDQMCELVKESFKRKNLTSMTTYVLEISMGISFGLCTDKKSMEKLLAEADSAMYEDKRQSEVVKGTF